MISASSRAPARVSICTRPADAQLAHRPDDLDQKSLHGLDPPENLDLLDIGDFGNQ